MDEQQKFTADILSIFVKYRIDQDHSVDDTLKEAQKELIDTAKELCVNNDEAKALMHATKFVRILSQRKKLIK